MNDEMKATAQVIAKAQAVVSEGGQLTSDTYWDNNDEPEGQVVIPQKEFTALAEALDDWEGLAELSEVECEDGPTRNQRFTRLCHK